MTNENKTMTYVVMKEFVSHRQWYPGDIFETDIPLAGLVKRGIIKEKKSNTKFVNSNSIIPDHHPIAQRQELSHDAHKRSKEEMTLDAKFEAAAHMNLLASRGVEIETSSSQAKPHNKDLHLPRAKLDIKNSIKRRKVMDAEDTISNTTRRVKKKEVSLEGEGLMDAADLIRARSTNIKPKSSKLGYDTRHHPRP